MFSEALEAWEIWGYPILVIGTLAVIAHPISWNWGNLWRLEVVLSVVALVLEVWQGRRKRPGLVRVALIAVPLSVAYGLFNLGDPKVIYVITLGLCAYLAFLFWGMDALTRLLSRLRR